MLNIGFILLNDNLKKKRAEMFDVLPESLRAEILRIRSPLSQLQKVYSRLLLFAIPELRTFISNFDRTDKGRPFIRGFRGDFSISHSEDLIAIAWTDSDFVGLDIEKKREILTTGFEQFFSAEEWQSIQNAESPQNELLKTWTIKEAVLKAKGIGFTNTSTECIVDYGLKTASISGNDELWHWDHVLLNPSYHVSFAVSGKKQIPIVTDFSDLV